ncbi:MAG: dipeptide epimerase [Desulfobacterium sp.]|nr:dipeptide epimerase [Desulfobacterium sp.]
MKILDIQTQTVSIPLKQTFKTALRTVDCIENVCIRIKTDTDHEGYGGAAPTAVITGETTASITGAVAHIAEQLRGEEIENLETVLGKLNACIIGNGSAKAAVDMALYDLYGKRFNMPVYRLLGGPSSQLTTDMTICIDTLEKMSADAKVAVENGFDTLKIKVGNDPDLDFRRLQTIRGATGPSVKLRIDANQGWRPKEAVLVMERLSKANIEIELLEQPVFAKDFQGMKFVRDRVSVPVVADESVCSPQDALQILEMRAVDGINIKLMKCGGIYNALKIAAITESAGGICMIGSMMESAVSVAAAVHLAKAKPGISRYDLDAPLFCSEDPSGGSLKYQGPGLDVRELPGLGIEPMTVFS